MIAYLYVLMSNRSQEGSIHVSSPTPLYPACGLEWSNPRRQNTSIEKELKLTVPGMFYRNLSTL
jgi:hypothetical protein